MRLPLMLLTCLAFTACSDVESRTVEPRYLKPEALLAMLRQPENDIGQSVTLMMASGSPVITVEGKTDEVASVLALIRRYDRPAPVVRFRFQLVEADGFSTRDPAIADVEAALREVFRFRGYRLVAESVAQGEAPGFIRQQIATLDGEPVRIIANLTRVVTDGDAPAVSFEVDLALGSGSLLTTTVTLPIGKTAVVGSAQARADGNTLILVVRPEIQ